MNRPARPANLALTLCFLLALTATVLRGAGEEKVTVNFRTLGWDMETDTMTLAPSGVNIPVSLSQFSKTFTYSGPPVMRFYRSMTKEQETARIQTAARTEDTTQPTSIESLPAPQAAEDLPPPSYYADVSIPAGAKDLLLVFLKAPPGSSEWSGPVLVIDDSKASTDTRNVHFYNLSSQNLIARVFDITKKIPAKEQALWSLQPDEEKTFVAIAVTDPEEKLVYSSRYRIAGAHRVVLFAHSSAGNEKNIAPKVQVRTLFLNLDEKALAAPQGQNQAP